MMRSPSPLQSLDESLNRVANAAMFVSRFKQPQISPEEALALDAAVLALRMRVAEMMLREARKPKEKPPPPVFENILLDKRRGAA